MPKNSSGPRNAPPVYRPQPVPKVLQQKSALTKRHGQGTITPSASQWSPERITGVAKMGSAQRPALAVAGNRAQTDEFGPSIKAWSPALFPKSTGTLQTKKKKKKAAPVKSKAQKSWDNLVCYSLNKAQLVSHEYTNNEVGIMQEFITYYSNGIRGHCSGGSGDKANAATKLDLQAFNAWYNKNKKK